MSRNSYPTWALRQIRTSGWHLRHEYHYQPIRPMPGDAPISVADVEAMVAEGVLIRVPQGDSDGVVHPAWGKRRGGFDGAR